MAISTDEIITQVSKQLNDVEHERWKLEELIDFVNDGQLEIARKIPSAFAVTTPVQLVEGVRQTIPTDGVQLIDIPHASDASGAGGSNIRGIIPDDLEAELPGWRTAASSAIPEYFIYRITSPKTFEVYPPQPATPGYVMMQYAATPTRVAQGENIVIDDMYGPALISYVTHRAYKKEAEYNAPGGKAELEYGAFLSSLGVS